MGEKRWEKRERKKRKEREEEEGKRLMREVHVEREIKKTNKTEPSR